MKKLLIALLLMGPMGLPAQSLAGAMETPYDDIRLIRLTDDIYVHVTSHEFETFGKVWSNGLIVIRQGRAMLVDTPVTVDQTRRLCEWAEEHFDVRFDSFIGTHWHDDCIGGIEYLLERQIATWCTFQTRELAEAHRIPAPTNHFSDSLNLNFGGMDIYCFYPGPGHSLDNIVVWLPADQVLFGGCFIKDAHANNLGNTADGNPQAWRSSLAKLTDRIPGPLIVIPGHGAIGGPELIGHTQCLLVNASTGGQHQ